MMELGFHLRPVEGDSSGSPCGKLGTVFRLCVFGSVIGLGNARKGRCKIRRRSTKAFGEEKAVSSGEPRLQCPGPQG